MRARLGLVTRIRPVQPSSWACCPEAFGQAAPDTAHNPSRPERMQGTLAKLLENLPTI